MVNPRARVGLFWLVCVGKPCWQGTIETTQEKAHPEILGVLAKW